MAMYDADDIIKECLEYKRNRIRSLLKKCKPEQREIFNRMYTSVDKIEEEKMNWAIKQIVQTLNKNSKELKPVDSPKPKGPDNEVIKETII